MLTEDNTDQREDDQLGDDEERIVSRNDGAVHARVSICAHELCELAHDDWQRPSEQ